MVEQAMTRAFKKSAPMNYVASKLGVNKALVSKWYKGRIKLRDYRDSTVRSSKTPCRIRRNIETTINCSKTTCCPLAEAMLLEEYKQQRSKGAKLRKAVQSKRRRRPTFDKKWGRWLPTNRWNVDQVPLPFINEQATTYAYKGSKAVWVAQPSSGLDKRQATLQLMICAEGEQTVKPTVVFRGAGKVLLAEIEEHDKRVHVLFRKNAWMDKATNMKWANEVLIPGISDKRNENILFADNVSFQLLEGFHQVCRKKASMIVYMLPPNQTDKVQPIDQEDWRVS
eukprot:Seg821.9 transcript_id=Seg821.9/GoldUCD/mRNA.D3Y31 product="hypothetical protein" protein_id=Seg821.9/GoldUCD/D3Y31